MPPKPMAKIKKPPPFYNLKFLDGCSFHFKKMSHVNIHKFKAKHKEEPRRWVNKYVSLYTTQTYFSIQSDFCIKSVMFIFLSYIKVPIGIKVSKKT